MYSNTILSYLWQMFKLMKYRSSYLILLKSFNFRATISKIILRQILIVSIHLKRALSQKCLYPGLFTNWPGILWTGFVDKISWPEMKSAANDDRRVKRTMPCYFKHVAIFRDRHYPNRSFRDALCMCYFNNNFMKTICFLSNRIRSNKGLENHSLLKFH